MRGDRVFGPLAREYAAGRPGYPEALWVAIAGRRPASPALAIDLAAGTGAATDGLLGLGGSVAAVEPSEPMRLEAARRLAGRSGWLGAAGGRAEAIPLISGTAGLVTVAQAFHWFDPGPALDEIARVLVPGGLLAIFWNVVEEDPFVESVVELVGAYNSGYGRPVTREMIPTPSALAEHTDFRVEPPALFSHARRMTADRYVEYARSWSYCGGALDEAGFADFERDLRALISRHHEDAPWEERFQVAAHFARRR
ncbi:MAG TPA: class I SAM-dependent methyltransferase [Gemmatimonadota bacterium]|nr:class I SAM-dependent methyltransferase [Gemmatimonadota bacterium]